MNGVFLNHTNHLSHNWSELQKSAAEKYGTILDFPFPDINPDWSEESVSQLAQENCKKILELQPAAVLCQGEFTYCYHLISLLKMNGVIVLAACSKRETKEWEEKGQLVKKAVFSFVRFRRY